MIVANSILETQLREQQKNEDFAILYRTNAQSRAMEEALRKRNIAYKIYGGLSFYQRKEIKDLIAYFRLVINPKDEEAIKRVINYPARGIGKTSLDKIIITANNNDKSVWDVISNINLFNTGLNSGAQNKVSEFVNMINSFKSLTEHKNAYDVGNEIASTTGILKELYNDRTPEGISRYENIQELLNGLKEFTESGEEDEIKTLAEFLQDVALLTDADNEKSEDKNKVTLMTIHSAKGLEFPFVYIVGLEENLFPSQMSLTSRADLEEERRLFYVALTRAEKQVSLSFAASRYKWGNLIYCEPSRFIEEIDEQFLEFTFQQKGSTPSAAKPERPQHRQSTPTTSSRPKKLVKMPTSSANAGVSANDLNLKVGMSVEHQKFGKGQVMELEGQKATIKFDSAGQKQLLLKFAKLKVLNN